MSQAIYKEFYPGAVFKNVCEITPEFLAEHGIKGLALDADNTLVYDATNEVIPGVKDWVETMQNAGIKLLIASNAFQKHVREVSEQLGGLPFQHRSHKPNPEACRTAAERLGLPLHEIAMVGDQMLTDIRGANRAGVFAIYVMPSRAETRFKWVFKYRRAKEAKILEEWKGTQQ